jgi:hypothetical protein
MWCVGKVEELEAELHPLGFPDRKHLESGEVAIDVFQTADQVAAGVTRLDPR